jgi:peptidoglycan DL-endopeptidase CwlO
VLRKVGRNGISGFRKPVLNALVAIGAVLFGGFLAIMVNGAGTSTSAQTSTAVCQLPASDDAKTDIPGDYLALYQQAGRRFGVDWNILAAIGKVQSNHGRVPNTDPARFGPMRIRIADGKVWGGAPRHRAAENSGYGVDADGDGWVDVDSPADAVWFVGNFLGSHGYRDLRAYESSEYGRNVLTWAASYAVGFSADAATRACPA